MYEVTQSVTQALTELRQLPIPRLIGQLAEASQGINAIGHSPEVKDLIGTMSATAEVAARGLQRMDEQIAPELRALWRLALVIVGGLFLGLEACTSTPSRFYLLNSLSTSETMAATATPQGPIIGVGPITMPKYLDRPQIVTRTGDNQLALGEFDRWAEPLQDNVARVLAENLARLIPTDQVLLQTWPRSAPLDYQVTVEVLQFDGWLGGESRLVALWSILDGAELSLWSQRAALNAPVSGREYEALVIAMSQLLESFSRDLAGAIQRLASRVVAHE
jgi:uncharacterized lipoprotein YmbA